METKETLIIKDVLKQSLFGSNGKLAKEYGTDEVTIGFQRNGKGKEKVDFISYDPKSDDLKCYEIKVSMQDFHSKAKKSFYGNYNYMVLSDRLFSSKNLEYWKSEIPNGVGIIVVDTVTKSRKTILKARRRVIDANQKEELKNSLIRSLFYKTIQQKSA